MLSWRMMKHSINMVVNNFGVAMKIAVPFIAALVLSLIFFGQDVFTGQMEMDFMNPQPMDMGYEIRSALASLLQAIAGLWVAVAWHRYILLEETPNGVLPPFNGSRILSYFGHGLLLALVAFGIMFVFGLIGGGLMAAGGGSFLSVLGGAIMFFGGLVVAVVAARLYIVLPAAAIGRSIKLTAAWEATKGYTGAIIGAYVFFVVIVVAIAILIGMLAAALGLVGVIILLAFNIVATMIGISFLTTIYGVTVEGRQLT